MRRLERGDLLARVEPPDERELGPVLASDEAGEAIQPPDRGWWLERRDLPPFGEERQRHEDVDALDARLAHRDCPRLLGPRVGRLKGRDLPAGGEEPDERRLRALIPDLRTLENISPR